MNVGIVESITSKDINTKYGLKKKYSVKIDGTWYDAGWKKPTVAEGTTVSYGYKETSYGKELDGGLTPAVAGLGAGTSTAAKPAATRGKYESAPFPVPPLDPSRSIIRQNALRHATATVSMYMEHQRHIPPVNPLGGGVTSLCDSVILAAKRYESYISGYDDMSDAEAKVEKDA